MLVEDLDRVLGELCPWSVAEPWDNVGLLVGRRSSNVRKVLVCLDATEEVVVEAVTGGYGAVVSHHPLVFAPLRRVTDRDRVGVIISRLIAADVALFACHTNLDGAVGGLCDIAADELGLAGTWPLERTPTGWKKMVGFVPAESRERVARAVFAAGAGVIGDYTEGSFELPGEGTFLGGGRTKPRLGAAGRPERVAEVRWEAVVPAGRIAQVVQAYVDAHPYEEPAFDVYPLEDVRSRTGAGRVGRVPTATTLRSLAESVAYRLGMREAVYAGDPTRQIERVAVVTGSGTSLMAQAAQVADVLITGDVTYHDAERAADLGVALIVVPHGLFESWAMRRWTTTLAERLRAAAAAAVYSSAARSPWLHVGPSGAGGGPDSVVAMRTPTDRPAGDDNGPFILRVDGGSRGNPGPAAIGVVLEDAQGTVLEALGVRIGMATNNVAEYQAMITGLETAVDHGVRRLRVLSDSELLVKQLRSEYKVRAEALKNLFLQARSLLQQFERVELVHVPREENVAADELVNQALDGTI
ncbi:MAG: Nif3-like dinuclear metal center hexameric protein [Actinobacteria bacterium]|nr:Nif3-like dinuclear metal center hexameric protein [Actinomycetota bacterium]